jgi:hypothetical protein
MKTWRIVTILGLTVIVAALIVTTAFAYTSGQAISATYGTYGSYGGYGATSPYGTRGSMMGGPIGRMMGGGYATYGSGQYHNSYQQSLPRSQSATDPGNYGGCQMRNVRGRP